MTDLLTEAQAAIRWRSDGLPARRQSPLIRVLGRCVERGECWEYQGHHVAFGYGHARYLGRMVVTHRIVWLELNGEIPSGHVVCHTCDNPPCCNPAHLWIGTVADNNRDREAKGRSASNLIPGMGAVAARTSAACRQAGHSYTPENTRIDHRGSRRCRECERAAARRKYRRGQERAA